ncbi:SDR family NAD(P)-dependent oxidoreductase [Paenibacillus polymyxa]|uniref:SDR family NAD(P)-dependent oxidoreductase n=1 Tax=Paenibacillus polymyxa TaxID=1406 RepID=UPI0008FCBD83|nr:SDR family NAD(P)-dependent oxidoreductase [Paenibacillus polymyxa]
MTKTLMFEPIWCDQLSTFKKIEFERIIVLLCDPEKEFKGDICEYLKVKLSSAFKNHSFKNTVDAVDCSRIDTTENRRDRIFRDYALQSFQVLKNVMESKPRGHILFQIVSVLPRHAEQQLWAGLTGLLRTAKLENPKIVGQFIEINSACSAEKLLSILKENSQYPQEHHIRYVNDIRETASWKECNVQDQNHTIVELKSPVPWKDGGVYLITGGTGGIGQILSHEIADTVKHPTILLVGRSPVNSAKGFLSELQAKGARVIYESVDITDLISIQKWMNLVVEEHGQFNGVIHCAGVHKDNFIIKKDSSEVDEIMSPKVAGTVNLDEITKDMKLDFFLLFSSAAGAVGSVGQADYALANSFMDRYAAYRNELANRRERYGWTQSINWALWERGGMKVDDVTKHTMKETMGVIPMLSTSAIKALYAVMKSEKQQVLCAEGEEQKLRNYILCNHVASNLKNKEQASSIIDKQRLRMQVQTKLKELMSKELKLEASQIDVFEPLETYGIDSLIIMSVNRKLAEVFDDCSKTLFYEYRTLHELSEYFTENMTDSCFEWTGFQITTQDGGESQDHTQVETRKLRGQLLKKTKKTNSFFYTSSPSSRNKPKDPIAIIGISGHYPEADNLDEYWNNLKNGKDCISEIPTDRWTLDDFYEPDPNKALVEGKSYSKWGGFLQGFSNFDSLFFNISPREAINMDPQERIFIQTCWEALEDSGYTRALIKQRHFGKVGVYAGITKTGFSLYGPTFWSQGDKLFPHTSFSSVANRISYLLNLNGPSMPVDTMCSSSLTAIHQACQHLHNGDCEMAIAGGVNLYMHPSNYIELCNAKMLSVDGKCKSFGQGANGFVPGEGVGAVILKPLSRALADEDHIYALISASHINHGGKTNGYTVPNPVAQGKLIREAIQKAGVNARAISYIEAHGTGTELGDPIEITGLQQAFDKDTQDTDFCAIGSVKTNIGHLEAAAGIAGLTKIVLQLKHSQLVPSLYADKLNQNINFSKTPFFVQNQLSEWKRPLLNTGKELPRIAGISSFGAGGSNAHVIIEEYIPKAESKPVWTVSPEQPAIVVLSARNTERLQEQAGQLLQAIEETQIPDERLGDLAYTLQIGREPMETRLGFLASSMHDLRDKLTAYLSGEAGKAELYTGQVKRGGEGVRTLTLDEDMHEAVGKWMEKRKYAKLLDWWARGLNVEWNQLYGNVRPRRMSLPTYPFARERYWVPQTADPRVLPAGLNPADAPARAVLHPLLQENTSDLAGQRYSSTFWGTEPFLRDHVVQGAAVLPGVAYLEMARAAMESARGTQEQPGVLQLSRIVWSRPLQVEGDAVQVDIGLAVEEDGRICYDIYQETGVSGETVVYSQGQARWLEASPLARVDLAARQAACTQGVMEGAACYAQFAKLGLQYGPTHQGLVRLHLGEGEVLAHVRLPEEARASQALYTLHPALMDAVLQGCLGLQLTAGEGAPEPELPFALEALEVRQACPEEGWAWIRYSAGSGPEARVRKLDIEVCDLQGQVCVRLSGFSTRPLHGEKAQLGTVMAEPVWHAQEVPAAHAQQETEEVHLVLLCDPPESASLPGEETAWAELLDLLQTSPQVVCHRLQAEAQRLEQRYEQYAMQALERIQEVLRSKPQQRVLIQIVSVDSEAEEAGYAALWSGLTGLLRTAQLEQPKLRGQMIELGRLSTGQEGLQRLQDNRRCPQETDIRYRAGAREVARWQVCPEPTSLETLPWKDGGVYLVTGGAGGLGQRVAQDIAAKTKHPILILAGRSPESAAAEPLAQLRAQGAEAIYAQLDVTDGPAVHALMKQIQQKYGALNGVIHSAGVIEDQYLLKKNVAEGKRVLAPKVAGTVHLDEATRGMKLDLFLLFSSIAGVLGNAGQADYAMANAFMDRYAVYRQERVKQGIGHGRTLSLNWPLWAEGGMQVDLATRQRMEQQLGMTPLRTTTGITLLYQALAGTSARIMAAEGRVARLRTVLLNETAPARATVQVEPEVEGVDSTALQDEVEHALTRQISNMLKVKLDEIDHEGELHEYGFDSITLTELANVLNQTYTLDLTPTIFFEYATIRDLAGYLVREHREALSRSFGGTKQTAASVPARPSFVEPQAYESESGQSPVRLAGRGHRTGFAPAASAPTAREAIAIIGMSGKFPGANNVDELWQGLVSGIDGIREIPAERWDWRAYYGDPQEETNKTNIKWGGFMEGMDEFDPLFFGISPREAELMDPQQRLLMTYVWKAIEDAGYAAQSLSGSSTGIFVGTGSTGYHELIAQSQVAIEGYSSTGKVPSVGPNRMSYFLNLHGPSEPIETACSSSLIAVHRAVRAMQAGDCAMAVVGGVNTLVSPADYISFNKAGMLSEDGRCKTFSAEANGYVRGEGVGMIVLKRLSEAERDGDHIYGVIRGTEENHGGRANSLTAPNPKAQTELLKSAYRKAGIHPATVSYVETHGTGTPLGDPIEISGLKHAFEELSEEMTAPGLGSGTPQVRCGLGSVKTNIGHLELAAGIAGVIKILLQMKHQTLSKTLHFERLNPYIDLQDSPFYIVEETMPWEALTDAQGQEIPRRAGVSSFGFGGSNAHVIIEEYISKAESKPVWTVSPEQPAIVVLSARNTERLQEQAGQLLQAIEETQIPDERLGDLAYTLQIGREPMETRLGFLASSMHDLRDKLTAYLSGEAGKAELYTGQVKRGGEGVRTLTLDEDMHEAVGKWMEKRKYAKLLDWWARGLNVEWNQLYGNVRPRRMSLPTYPFARERYWVPQPAEPRVLPAGLNPADAPARAVLHPLLQENTSDLAGQRYSSTFWGTEPFLRDHVVQGAAVLPGVAYLEMARAAMESARGTQEQPGVLQLSRIVWSRPLQVEGDAVQVDIGLAVEEDGRICYDIYQETGVSGETVVYSQGQARWLEASPLARVDLAARQASCTQGVMEGAACYTQFAKLGLQYGPTHQGLVRLHLGEGEVLAHVRLPEEARASQALYTLHPALMDAVLQGCLGLQLTAGEGAPEPELPFALEALEVRQACPEEGWAWIRYSAGSGPEARVRKLDIEVCDLQGQVCVRLSGFSTRPLHGEKAQLGTVMAEPVWHAQEVPAAHAQQETEEVHLVLLCDPPESASLPGEETAWAELLDLLQTSPQVVCHRLQAEAQRLEQRYEQYAMQALERIQEVLRSKPQQRVLIQIVSVDSEAEEAGYAALWSGLTGLLRTAQLEQPKLRGQMIELGRLSTGQEGLQRLQDNRRCPQETDIRYRAGAREVARWQVCPEPTSLETLPWKDGGVYLVTGGAGGLGQRVAQDIAAKTKHPILILAGRSPESAAAEPLAQLRAQGAEAIYAQLDVTDGPAVHALMKQIQQKYGALNGVIHSAGVIEDQYLLKKNVAEGKRVLAPKVAGTVHLDEATRGMKLDLFLLFSSIAGVLGNAGQADYAMANAFMDRYAVYRQERVKQGIGHGRTLSLNWPLWAEGGMQVDLATRQRMEQQLGMTPLRTTTGITLLYQALAGTSARIMAAEGRVARLRTVLLNETAPARATVQVEPEVEGVDSTALQDEVEHALTRQISNMLKVKLDEIDHEGELHEYGFDSITLTELANVLNQTYTLDLTPTIFFEYATIRDLAGYLVREHREALSRSFGGTKQTAASVPARPSFVEPQAYESESGQSPVRLAGRGHRTGFAPAASAPTAREAIAIIGMSGKFPGANNVDELWQGLVSGIDGIREIPAERWDWRAYYGDPQEETNKTNIKWGGFMEGMDEFDPLFFGISPREAELMDPQQRLLMTYVWKAIEDAGYAAQSLSGSSTGIFVGTGSTGYHELIAQSQVAIEGYSSTGKVPSVGPNRMSYFLNLHGPSEPIETACSSSLIAVHRAVRAMQAGDCAMAVVGGVNTLVSPADYISFNKAGMLSEDGRCKTFSAEANGYVRGEGVGMIVLKRLSEAERDGDHIYGVIRGTEENHGGRANSLTAPNPKAQTELLKSAYRKAGIHPATVSYVETHGTGTPLGDPIEISGLKHAFEELSEEMTAPGLGSGTPQVRCGLGSVKTNIGHLELAAGIAGVIKILLQMKHQTLSKTLHFERLNPYIDLQDSPFYIVEETMPWEALTDAQGQEIPRRAGVSSFGFGGSNAHVIIEEYIPKAESKPVWTVSPEQPAIVVLSARNTERLQEQAGQLLQAIEETQIPDERLGDLAYTLQIGREPMETRLGFLASSMHDLRDKLTAYLSGEAGKAELYTGQVKRGGEGVRTLTLDEDMHEAVGKWMEKRKYAKLLDWWARGLNVEWNQLYGNVRPRRMSLPTYPFARERYWVPQPAEPRVLSVGAAPTRGVLHPLLQENTSDLAGQRYSSTFWGTEPFLRDHVVQGAAVLPGVAYLEMARAAVESARGTQEQPGVLQLSRIVWSRPLQVKGDAVQVDIGLAVEEDGRICYDIYQETGVSGETVVYSQGQACWLEASPLARVDLAARQAACTQGVMEGAACYAQFAKLGLQYGATHQGLVRLHLGEGEVLAHVRLPEEARASQALYTLHPALMDAVLQGCLGLQLAAGQGAPEPELPFALEALEVRQACPEEGWAWIRYSAGSGPEARVRKLDIEVCDLQGQVCVRLSGFSTRPLHGEKAQLGTVMAEPVWHAQEVPAAHAQQETEEVHLVLLCDPPESASPVAWAELLDLLQTSPQVVCHRLQAEAQRLEQRYEQYAMQALERIQEVLRSKPQQRVLIQIVSVDSEAEEAGYAALWSGLTGLLRTAQLEQPKLRGQMIELGRLSTGQEGLQRLQDNRRCPQETDIRYRAGAREVARWQVCPEPTSLETLPWKDGGVYLVTGGAGGLGQRVAQDIAAKTKHPILILAGRSPESAAAEPLAQLRAQGAEAIYAQLDVTDGPAVHALMKQIQQKYGALNGVIHSAGVIEDQYLLKKNVAEGKRVLAPKVAGTVHLDEATRGMKLDLFLLFSSIAGVLGNAGQADYAMANAFMDRYAVYRQERVKQGIGHGRTLSLNWPLWAEGGMQVDLATRQRMEQQLGMTPLRTTTGITLLYQALAGTSARIMAAEGRVARLRTVLLNETAPARATVQVEPEVEGVDSTALQDEVEHALTRQISNMLKVKLDEIDHEGELHEYGFDSITLTELANVLNQTYTLDLTPTIFFEYATIRDLAGYLVREHREALSRSFGGTKQTAASVPARPSFVEPQAYESESGQSPVRLAGRGHRTGFAPAASAPTAREAIAIIGMSGKFPGANNVDELWQGLVSGIDGIREIPAERWDWRAYYGDPQEETNKTNIKWGGFMEGMDEFDPLFFGISPREAELMDPQQRLLMTYVWKAIEDAGYAAQSLSGSSTGIFVGTGSTGYHELIAQSQVAIEGYSSTGKVPSVGPNRMSYFLNLHGPSEPIETACSSSLIAVHRAVRAMQAGDCAMAVVGGVNTLVSPADYISFNKAGMLSEDGRCKTFSAEANGYVRGEGVGMIVLKRLSEAERDGDHIYGVIRGTEENHGGRANSLTAPNPKAQTELLKSAYRKAGIHPATVSYVETHGTGTPLGDPIEISGLKHAFEELSEEMTAPGLGSGTPQVRCGLGSVKTNIGHLELAAGIAGVIKILLQMKHQTLSKTLHFERLNPYIDLQDSPFYIVEETMPWEALTDAQGQEIPRRAGVSSFGFGGSNAHVIIEEYIPKAESKPVWTVSPEQPAIVVLSARNTERLQEQAGQLLQAIEETQIPDERLGDLAYTLQIGREPMETRLGFLASSMHDLRDKLTAYLSGEAGKAELYTGQVKRGGEGVRTLTLDEDMHEAVGKWMEKRKYAKLLDWWARGLNVEWNQLYGNVRPRRMSLPTYPFARERYWVPQPAEPRVLSVGAAPTRGVLHPLLQENTSDLAGQRYSSTFWGTEPFLRDHVVQGAAVLPGVAYLEMALAAVESARGTQEQPGVLQLSRIVWSRPLQVKGDAVQVDIGLAVEEDGRICYDIYQETGVSGETVVYSQGQACWLEASPLARVDLAARQAACTQGVMEGAACYAQFAKLGLQYGPTHQGLVRLHLGEGEVLAHVRLPEEARASQALYTLHPALMDAVLQGCLGLQLAAGEGAPEPELPFALEALEVRQACPEEGWAWIRYSAGSGPEARVRKLDIEVCDPQGQVCVRLSGFSTRPLHKERTVEHANSDSLNTLKQPDMASSAVAAEPIMLTPVWETFQPEFYQDSLPPSGRLVIIGEDATRLQSFLNHYPDAYKLQLHSGHTIKDISQELEALGIIDHLVWIGPAYNAAQLVDESIISDQEKGVMLVFRIIKSLLQAGYGSRPLHWTLITQQAQPVHMYDAVNPAHASLHGLMGSVAKEYARWNIKVLDMETKEEWPLEEMMVTSSQPYEGVWICREGDWYRRELIPVSMSVPENTKLRLGGVYVVIGGAGGIGTVWSEYMIRTYQAQIIWIGRRPQNEEIVHQIQRLSKLGPAPTYITVDAADEVGLAQACRQIKERYGNIHGVVHSAIVLCDKSISCMEEERFRTGLRAKVDVSVQLAQVFGGEELDFMLFFSSMNSFLQAAGQSNYVAGCVFEDAFAHQLSLEGGCTAKVVNWGYWGSVGVVASEEYQKIMSTQGWGSIEPQEAMKVIEALLAGNLNQIAFLKAHQKLAIEGVAWEKSLVLL